VVAYRLAANHLASPVPVDRWSEAAGIGWQNTPPGAAALALAARVPDLAPDVLDGALARAKTMLQVWSARHAPYVFATADMPVFTHAMAPRDDAEMTVALSGFAPVVATTGRPPTEIVARVAEALLDALDGRELTKRELGVALGERLPDLVGWFDPNYFTSTSATLVRPVALTGVFCFAPRSGNESSFRRTDQWLTVPPPAFTPVAADAAAAELARRYLDAYGPATTADLAAWAGVAQTVAERAFRPIAAELAQVTVDGRVGHVRRERLPLLLDPPSPPRLVMVPAYDPFLAAPRRDLLTPSAAVARRIWRPTANPGVVIRAGEVAALWRAGKKGARLAVTIEPLDKLTTTDRDTIDAQAQRYAPWRGCTSATVSYPT
jgi:DNA glycosylase AlkZ-like